MCKNRHFYHLLRTNRALFWLMAGNTRHRWRYCTAAAQPLAVSLSLYHSWLLPVYLFLLLITEFFLLEISVGSRAGT